MLVLAPISCVMGGIAMSAALRRFTARLKSFNHDQTEALPIKQTVAFLITRPGPLGPSGPRRFPE